MKIAEERGMAPKENAYTLQVQWSDGSWEDMHFKDEVEAKGFVLSVYTYHQTGLGEEWHGDIFKIVPRPFLGSIN